MAGGISVFLCVCLLNISVSLAQNFGYPNQREYRRFQNQQYGFNQNNRENYKLSATVHLQPVNRPETYNYPFNSRPNQFYYDYYGRPVVNPAQNRPYEDYSWQNQQTWGNSQRENVEQKVPGFFNNGESNGQYVNFPDKPEFPVVISGENNGRSENMNFANSDDFVQPTVPPFVEPSRLPPLTPVPTTEPAASTTLPPLTPAATESEPVFTSAPVEKYSNLTPAPLDSQDSGPALLPADTTTLPPLTPVPSSESRNNFNFGPAGIFNEPCEVDGTKGSCLPLHSCDIYSKLLVQAKSDPKVVTLLRKAHCGFEGSDPKVCCPLPGIPDQPPPSPTPSPGPIPTVKPSAETKAVDTDASDYLDALPEPPICGNSTATLSRVVGGVDAKLGDFPWMALLGYKKRGNVAWSCGGSLISSKHVLTAAHCIHNLEKTLYVVRLGELDLAKEDEGATPVDVLIKKMMKHEGFNRSTLSNDIGMLLLERSVQFTDLIRPICIPTSQKLRATTFENYNPLVAGWGSVAWEGPSASKLQVLQLPVVGNTFCRERFQAYKQLTIDERVMCAGYKKGGKDACQGDSGGPLMQPIWNEDYTTYFYQIGVVSFGKKCAEPGFPGVYTRVTTFVPWIEEKLLGPTSTTNL